MAECTGVERFVQEMIIKEDPNFFPINKSLGLEEEELEEEKIEKIIIWWRQFEKLTIYILRAPIFNLRIHF